MNFILSLVMFISLISLIVGLIKPRSVIRWGDENKKTRSNVAKIYGGLLLTSIILLAIVADEPNTSPPIETQTSTGSDVEYNIIQEEDISYLNCKRITIRVTVPDSSQKEDVDYTLGQIVNSYKNKGWEDVTAWAWKYSEEQEVKEGFIPYSMGIKEYSSCN